MSNRDNYLGEFEHIVLLAIMRLGSSAYGTTIRIKIHEQINRDISIGALYSTLERLEKKGYIDSKLGQATEMRGGRAKKYFSINANGKRALQHTRDNLEAMWNGLSYKQGETL